MERGGHGFGSTPDRIVFEGFYFPRDLFLLLDRFDSALNDIYSFGRMATDVINSRVISLAQRVPPRGSITCNIMSEQE